MTSPTDQPVVVQTSTITSESELNDWVAGFAAKLELPSVVLLSGPMGSGKTTLVRALMQNLNGEQASSPTFSLVNEYRYPNGMVYHFDLYRLDETDELDEIGFEEYLQSDALILIEWPELGLPYYQPELTETIRIDVLPDGSRKIQWFNGIAL